MQVGILTVSDRASADVYEDQSGALIRKIVEERLRWTVASTAIIPDDYRLIRENLIAWADQEKLNLILTTGGTGFSPRDVTPEATRDVIDREAPGMAEAMRAAGLVVTPHAMLSRAVCGMRGSTLIVNLPGSLKAVKENLEVLLPVLPHALELLTGAPGAEAGHTRLSTA